MNKEYKKTIAKIEFSKKPFIGPSIIMLLLMLIVGNTMIIRTTGYNDIGSYCLLVISVLLTLFLLIDNLFSLYMKKKINKEFKTKEKKELTNLLEKKLIDDLSIYSESDLANIIKVAGLNEKDYILEEIKRRMLESYGINDFYSLLLEIEDKESISLKNN
tara:strand:- start:6219 stop:6698 length:480 start_codon:yes stop_codon:yes gene_type:complete